MCKVVEEHFLQISLERHCECVSLWRRAVCATWMSHGFVLRGPNILSLMKLFNVGRTQLCLFRWDFATFFLHIGFFVAEAMKGRLILRSHINSHLAVGRVAVASLYVCLNISEYDVRGRDLFISTYIFGLSKSSMPFYRPVCVRRGFPAQAPRTST